jgi:outer membrane protein OmpA-like peptidoglycan-associated protein
MNKLISVSVLSAMSLALGACASSPNPNLEQAEANYSALQSQPQANTLASLETKEAGDMLARTKQAYEAKQDTADVDHLAYITNKRIEVAQQTIALKSAEESLKNVPSQRTEARLDARTQQLEVLKRELQAKQTERGAVYTFGDVLFEVDRAELRPAGMVKVQELAAFLQQYPDRQVVVEGFTDSTGTVDHNLRLSQARADSVRRVLVASGVAPTRIVTQGFGKDYPVASNDTPASRAMNRRVEVTVSNTPAAPVAPRVLSAQ